MLGANLLQFHWWDYSNRYYMDALKYLSDLQEEGIIKHIGLTNFDTERMQIMIDSDLQIVSNQVQYSIINRRPEYTMIPFCLDHNIRLLSYGSICGGLMSGRYLGRMPPSAARVRYAKFTEIQGDDRRMGRMEFVPRTFIDFAENCTKTQCKYRKCGFTLHSCQACSSRRCYWC